MSNEAPSNLPETPKAAVARLSLYLRQLESLERTGQQTISSRQLGRALDLTDAQVRKDLAYFGQFGYPGVGYRIVELRQALRAVLGIDRPWRAALIGVGNLGRALLGYRGFQERRCTIIGLFDVDPAVVGRRFNEMEVHPVNRLPELTRREQIDLAVLAVPAEAAQPVANLAGSAGIVGILNFAPVTLKTLDRVSIVTVDLGLQLEQLVFQVHQRASGSASRTSE